MKLLCTVSKILMCWKLCHETSIEDGLTFTAKTIDVNGNNSNTSEDGIH